MAATDPAIPMEETRPSLSSSLVPVASTRICDVTRSLRNGHCRRRESAYDAARRVYFGSAADLLCRARTPSNAAQHHCSKKELLTRAFDASIAAQLAVALMDDAATNPPSVEFGSQRPDGAATTATGLATTSQPLGTTPWQAHLRQTVGIKTNTGVRIREHIKLARAAAIRDLAHDSVASAAIVAELTFALAKYKGNAAGPCREAALQALDIYGGWHLGAASAACATHTVQYVKTQHGKIHAVLVDEDPDQEDKDEVSEEYQREHHHQPTSSVPHTSYHAAIRPGARVYLDHHGLATVTHVHVGTVDVTLLHDATPLTGIPLDGLADRLVPCIRRASLAARHSGDRMHRTPRPAHRLLEEIGYGHSVACTDRVDPTSELQSQSTFVTLRLGNTKFYCANDAFTHVSATLNPGDSSTPV